MNSETHVELPGSRRALKHGAIRVRDVDPHTRVEVTLTLKGPTLPPADEVSGHALSAEEMQERYGVAQSVLQRVEQVLRGYGLTVESVSAWGRSLRVSGPASAFEAAFRPNLAIYRVAGQGEFRGREGSLEVPAELRDVVTGVLGLDQRQVAKRKAVAARAAQAVAPLKPSDLEQLYAFPNGDCSGITIAIAEFGQPDPQFGMLTPAYLAADVAQFCSDNGRPPPQVKIVPVNVTPLTPTQYEHLPADVQSAVQDLTGEVMMDVEIITALAPRADVLVYFASFDQKGWVDLLDEVVAGTASADASATPVVLSVSWGAAEDSSDWASGAVDAINERLQLATLRGITICVASGDDGTNDQIDDRRGHVDFPASSPFVLGVGGTMIDGGTEVVWWESPGRRTRNNTGGATGGGVSVRFPRPAWQAVNVATHNPVPFDGRVVPDVAALAGAPYYDVILNGESGAIGGTSAAAPVWAALIARLVAGLPNGKHNRFLTPLLYKASADGVPAGHSACRDITQGNNASRPQPGWGYTAGPGYDATTGWGVPNGTELRKMLRSA